MKTQKLYLALPLLALLLTLAGVSRSQTGDQLPGRSDIVYAGQQIFELNAHIGPDHGKLRSVAFDPVNEGVIYASSYHGAHIIQSTDHGQSWSFLYSVPTPVPGSNSGPVSKLCGEPLNTNLTGDCRVDIERLRFANQNEPTHLYFLVSGNGDNVCASVSGIYIFDVQTRELVDIVSVESEGTYVVIREYDVCRDDPGKMVFSGYFGLNSFVWQTTDGGESTDIIYDREDFEHRHPWLVRYHPADSDMLYVSVSLSHINENGAMLRSVDGGASWSVVYEEGSQKIRRMVWRPDGAIFAITSTRNQGPYLLVSHDHGATWQELDPGISLPDISSFAFNDIATHPECSNTMWITCTHYYFLMTSDGGDSWEYVAFPEEEHGPFFYYFGDEITVNPLQGDHLVVAGGRHPIQTFDNGSTWEVLTNKMTNIRSINATVYPGGETYLYYTTMGSYHAKNLTSNVVNEYKEDQHHLSFYAIFGDKYSGSRSFMGRYGGNNQGLTLFQSNDHFTTEPAHILHHLTPGLIEVTGTPEQEGLYWYITGSGDSNYLRRTTNDFASSVMLGFITGEMSSEETITALRVVGDEPGALWAAANGTYLKGVFRSGDYGDSWTYSSFGLPFGADILTLALHPGDSDVLIAAVGNNAGLYKTTDGGSGWSPVYEGYDFLSVFFSENDPDVVLAQPMGRPEPIYSLDGGLSWHEASCDVFIEAEYTTMAIVEYENSIDIFYGTNGAGILHYTFNIPQFFSVRFAVTDTAGEEIHDAVIAFEGTEHAPGHYTFDYIVPDTYSFVVSKAGYYDYQGEVAVLDADVEVAVVMEETSPVRVPDIAGTQWNVFPNPADTYIRIESTATMDRLEVYDLLGRSVRAASFSGARSGTLDVSGLPDGIYFLRAVMCCGDVSTVRFQVSGRR